ncbi:GYD domain-containing protein [Acidiphilium sp. AL]|uniref:GYD domain-containing protein n=1 Tax=Acidiphilium iwatense TaxID=768198 RepID=A0ABS9DVE8_9PROT|nr:MULTISPECIES: GYD domain-containing protein [Acidiphilium]MCF3946674.1 GYD domain-containing protein [Acidiphilium iwatense]MCU4159999.1 GYD domain-containing protein [Acidiphilium sp. AL]
MKYVLLGRLDAAWAGKQADRLKKAEAKLKELGIKLESIHYTQGKYDFVDVVDVPDAEAMLSFSVWYAGQGFGRIESLPAFEPKSFEAAVKKAAK